MHHMIRDSFSRLVTVTSHRTTIPSPAPSPRRSAALSSSTVATSMAPELDKLPRKRCGPTAVQLEAPAVGCSYGNGTFLFFC